MAINSYSIAILVAFLLTDCGVVLCSNAPYKFNDLLVLMARSSNKLDYYDIQDVLYSLHFENCSLTKRSKDCYRCLTADDLGVNVKTVLNDTSFAEKAPRIVYSLLPEKNSGQSKVCDGIPSFPGKLFETLVQNFTDGKAKGITQQALESILQRINITLGAHLHKRKCFSAEGVIEEVKHGEDDHHHGSNESELDEHDFEKASAIIIYRLLQGDCIVEHEAHANLPSPLFFMDNLYKSKKYLTESDLEQITNKLGIAKKKSAAPTISSGSHDGHNHKRKRRAVETTSKTPMTPHNKTCFSLDSMLSVFGIDHEVGASKDAFKELCPAFIQQMQSGSCAAQNTPKTTTNNDVAKIWGYGFLAVTIISLVSLLGVATIPFVGKSMYKKVLALLVALAVGSLSGDAILHLIPHAFGLHVHEEEEVGGHDAHSPSPFIWKALVVLVSIYVFYLFEVMMHFGLKHKHTHSHVDIEIPGPSSHHMSCKKNTNCSDFEHHEGMPPNLGDSSENIRQGNGDVILTNVNQGPCCHSPSFHSRAQVFDNYTQSESETEELSSPESSKSDEVKKLPVGKKQSFRQSLSRRSVFSGDESNDRKVAERISAVAWMIIIGDTIHNISDGLAIGAAFSEGGSSGISGGISTSIAVFCHELPHELGDFAVLLTAGMSVRKALLANFLSACSCYIGLVIGIQVGQQLDVRMWIFAIAGGMFLYVALVDMLPDLMHSESLQTDTWQTFLIQNIGMLVGIGIMLVIAAYEENIMAAVKVS